MQLTTSRVTGNLFTSKIIIFTFKINKIQTGLTRHCHLGRSGCLGVVIETSPGLVLLRRKLRLFGFMFQLVGWFVGWLVGRLVKEQCSGWTSANLHLTVFRLGACRLHVLTRKTGLCHCVRFTAPRWGWETRAHRIWSPWKPPARMEVVCGSAQTSRTRNTNAFELAQQYFGFFRHTKNICTDSWPWNLFITVVCQPRFRCNLIRCHR